MRLRCLVVNANRVVVACQHEIRICRVDQKEAHIPGVGAPRSGWQNTPNIYLVVNRKGVTLACRVLLQYVVIAGSENDEATYAELMPSKIPQPSESLVSLETRAAVQNIVSEMPENLKSVLLLSYFHEFAYKEIAEMLNVPLGTVKSRLHAATKYFAKQYKAATERNEHD